MNEAPTISHVERKQEQYLKDLKYMMSSLDYFTNANVITEEERGLVKIL